MKKKITKLILLILITTFLINCVFIHHVTFADTEEVINLMANLVGGVISIIYYIKKLMVVIIAFCANKITTFIGKMDGVIDAGVIFTLSPFHIFFNKLQITDVNFFDLSISSTTATYKIRTAVSGWFYIMRLISASVLMAILIYVGIRMAISAIAEEKAKYKKMLVDWFSSIALIFLLQYICIFTVYANTAIVKALETVATNTDITDTMNKIAILGAVGVGINSISAALVYCMLTFQTLGLLIAYINRMLKIAFLIIISPLISITYSIDRMGDGKSQALDAWLKEFVYTILIQPFHCIVYIALIGSAFALLTNDNGVGVAISSLGTEYNQLANGVLAILCVKFTKDAEEIVRKIFGFKDDNNLTSMAAGMAVTMVAAKKAQNLGKSARKLTTSAKNFKDSNLFKAISDDSKNGRFKNLADKIDNSKGMQLAKNTKAGKGIGKGVDIVGNGISTVGSKVGTLANKAGTKIGNVGKKIGNGAKKVSDKYKLGEKANKIQGVAKKTHDKYGDFKGTKLGQFISARNSASSAFGIALGAMAYGSGSTNALAAIGIASAGEKGAEAFMETSSSTISREIAAQEDLQDKAAQEREKETHELEEKHKEVSDKLNDVDKELKAAENGEKADDIEKEIAEDTEKLDKITDKSSTQAISLQEKINDKQEKLKKIREIEERKGKLENQKKQIEDAITPSTEMILAEMDHQGSKYGENSKELERMLLDLKAALINLGQEDKFASLTKRITVEIELNPASFNLNNVLASTLDYNPNSNDDEYNSNYDMVRARARAIESHTIQSNIYKQYQKALSVGIKPEKLAQKVDSKRKSTRDFRK